MVKEILRRILKRDLPTPEDVAVRVENVQERSEDINHDLYVIKQRTGIVKRLVSDL